MPFYLPVVVVSSLLLMLPVGPVQAATTAGWGRVNMEGAIIETPCAIDTDSYDQTIDFSVLPLSQIIRNGDGGTRAFTIRLVNCVLGRADPTLPDWQRFQMTFDGEHRNGLFEVLGDARGVALQIADSQGRVAYPGEALPAGALTAGNKQLHYSIRLVGNQQVLRAGHYYSTVRFKLDYY